MEINLPISDFKQGMRVEGFYLLKDAAVKRASNGRMYLSASVMDSTGSVTMMMWDYSGSIDEQDVGKVVKVRGDVSVYKNANQITASRLRLATEQDEVDLSRLVPVAPIDVDARYQEVLALLATIEDPDYRSVAEEILRRHADAFRRIPAAKSVHHSFLNGLLMHTSNMLKTADFFAALYPEVIDRSLLIAGTLLHDLAKVREFELSDIGMATGYTIEGQLLGHLVMEAQEIASVCMELDLPEHKSVLLQHLILSHHGNPEFGAAVVPMTAEAELLALIDRVDSRMEIYAEVLPTLQPNSFSSRIFALEKKILRHE
ncbi:MAG: HD domain-containing protein [Oscillospiraceae bacterium]|nr:HD domain-containing protein [Oscillospiraceae bacterium]